MANWKTEYKVDYQIVTISNGVKEIEYSSVIIEGISQEHVVELINQQFVNVVGFSIDNITEIWNY